MRVMLAALLSRALRGGGWTTDLLRAGRTVSRSPGFALAAVLTIAIGIGAVTAIFTVLEQLVLRPLPIREQSRVVVVRNDHAQRNIPHFPFLLPAFEAVREGASSFVAVAATETGGAGEQIAELRDGSEEVLRVSRVLGDFFGVLGATPVLGRTLRATDDVSGGPRVAVISHTAWRRLWGGSPHVIGTTFRLHEEFFEIVGVLPAGADYPLGTDAWIAARPVFARWAGDGPWFELDLIARLRQDASAAQATAEITHIYATVPDLAPTYEGVRPVIRPLDEVLVGDLRGTLVLLFAGASLVLMVSFVNVASLVQVRAARHDSAVALRRALGAGRWRLIRESLAEAAWLGIAGGAAGVLVATAVVRWFVPLAPEGVYGLEQLTAPDASALLVAGLLTCAAVLLLATVPVVRAERVDSARALRSGGRSSRGRSARTGGVIVAQAALAVWSTAVGMLLLRSLLALQALDPGFRLNDLALVELEVPYAFGDVPRDYPDRLDAIVAAAQSHPAIVAVTAAVVPPLIGPGGWLFVPRLPGQTREQSIEQNPYANFEFIQPGYFATLELPIVRGRAIATDDREGAPLAVVVNEAAARLYWPGQDALGQTLGAMFGGADEWWTVVGVAADARYQDFLSTRAVVYFPLRQRNQFALPYLLVRTAGTGESVLPIIRDAVRAGDPGIRVRRASPLRPMIEAPMARPRFAVSILGSLAIVTLLLAAVGVYGVMAAAVRARTGEIGIRMACGAAPAHVRALILRNGMLLTAAGAAIGVASVVAGGGVVRSLLFGVAPTDLLSLLAGAVSMLGVALAACWVPAARASSTDPASVLRAD